MIDCTHMAVEVIRPALRHIGLWSDAAELLLLGTAATESHMGKYLRQVGGGPALSPWQIEPATHADVWRNYLAYRPDLASKVADLMPRYMATGAPEERPEAMLASLWYAAAIARLVYRRAPEPLPAAGDWAGMAKLWKHRYNTAEGKGTEGKFLTDCRRCGLLM